MAWQMPLNTRYVGQLQALSLEERLSVTSSGSRNDCAGRSRRRARRSKISTRARPWGIYPKLNHGWLPSREGQRADRRTFAVSARASSPAPLRISPVESTARCVHFACHGLWRSWLGIMRKSTSGVLEAAPNGWTCYTSMTSRSTRGPATATCWRSSRTLRQEIHVDHESPATGAVARLSSMRPTLADAIPRLLRA